MRGIFIKLSLPLVLVACGGETLDVDTGQTDVNEVSDIDKSLENADYSKTVTIGGKMFSIPSPVQMSMLLKNEVGVFNEEMLANPENVANYSTLFKKAIVMGVYGADLGYATIYENNSNSVSYLASLEKLSGDLGIANAFDEALLDRFIENGNNQDSMLVIMSDGYRKGDEFLKNNEQHDVATLILTGGWVESLYFATTSYKQKNSQEIANRIGEQKSSLNTIVELLENYNEDDFYTQLITELKDLQTDFNKIEFNYQYVKPQVNEAAGLTILKSKTAVTIDKETMSNIISKINNIRTNLIG